MRRLTKKHILITGTFVLLAGIGIVFGAMLGGGDVSTTTPTPKASTPRGAVNALTGKSGKAGSVLIVKIDNATPARPASNLDQADIVYGIQVEGGLSRIMAVYDGHRLPSFVGPVRSARETDLTLIPQFGRVAFAYSGATTSIIPELNAGPWKNVTPGQFGDFYRNHNRFAPHNEYLRTPPQLLNGVPAARSIGLQFGPLPAGGASQASISASMPAASFQFHWNGKNYNVGMDHSRSPWHADNVVIQDVSVSMVRKSHGGPVPFSDTLGDGKATVYRDGKAYHGSWSRSSKSASTHYTFHGTTMKLHTGRTWIILR
ncbi:DUF3048 domain-containing protein [Streptomyces sp. NPDC048419]|uniref:DUF3048 domain-containing protein n=1 Tax=Streptomyces sp. NPDC048419 TaxID=3365547 RepID=UPI003710AF70